MILQQWMWMGLALMAVTFAATLRSLFLVWVSIGAVVVGTISWADPTVPPMYQLLFFGAVTLTGVVLSQFFVKPKPESESNTDGEEPPVKAANASHLINRTLTLNQPIVDGFGEMEIVGVMWRLRGEDAQPGEQVRVLNVDGLERYLLIVAKEEWARRALDQTCRSNAARHVKRCSVITRAAAPL